MFAKVFLLAVTLAVVHAEPVPEPEAPVAISAPAVAYATAPFVVARSVSVAAPAPAPAPVATIPVRHAVAPVATSTSSQYFSRTYNGLTTYAVAAPVVDTRARFVAAAPSQVVVAAAPGQVVVNPAQFVATPTATSSQFVARSYNGLPVVTYYSVPTYAAAPVAVGVPVAPAGAPVPSAPVAPPTQSSSEVEVLDA